MSNLLQRTASQLADPNAVQTARAPQTLLPSQIRADASAQQRVSMSAGVVEEYAQAMGDGAPFPPIDVFFDGAVHWLADGFHRLSAHRTIFGEDKPISCRIMPGGRREALRHALGANNNHGLRRSSEDKRKSVQTALADEEWSQWSSREVAKLCKVSHTFVDKVRGALVGLTGNVASESVPVTPNNGNVAIVSPPTVTTRKFTTSTGKTATRTVEPRSAINGQCSVGTPPAPASVIAEVDRVDEEFASASNGQRSVAQPSGLLVDILAPNEDKIESLRKRLRAICDERDEYEQLGGNMQLWMYLEAAIVDATNTLGAA